ncbi:MAG: hypothetical protein K0R82_1253 [Flavipsychrobacter sp.]|jgi:Mn-dependent DtxR family transcriptional regulator|nr:hypothetical protein [Flavipsychrobacter sp.]
MATAEEVYKKIGELSERMLNQKPRVLLRDIAGELSISQNELLVLLAELENRGLIKIHRTAIASVSLTNYSLDLGEPSGGLES